MSWHYQVRRRVIDGEPWFDIVEVYGKTYGHTVEGMTPESETKEGVVRVLEMMLKDAKRYRTLVEKEGA